MSEAAKDQRPTAGSAKRALNSLPSHGAGPPPVKGSLLPLRKRRRGRGRSLFAVLGALAFVLAAAALASGALVPVLERQIMAAVQRALPEGLVAQTASTGLAFDLPGSAGVRFDGVSVSDAETGEAVFEAGTFSVTVRVGPLLRGVVDVSDIKIADAAVFLGSGGQALGLSDLQRLDVLKAETASAVEAAMSQIRRAGSGLDVRVEALTVQRDDAVVARIETARLLADDGLVASGTLATGGEPIALSARAVFGRDAPEQLSSLLVQAGPVPVPVGGFLTAFSNDPSDRTGGPRNHLVPASMEMTLERSSGDGLVAQVEIEPELIELKLAIDDQLPVEGAFSLRHAPGDDSISLLPRPAAIGQTGFELSGGLRWVETPGYGSGGYVDAELIANAGLLSPRDVPGDPLPFSARMRTHIYPAEKVADFPVLEIATQGGTMAGYGQLAWNEDVPIMVAYVTADLIETSALKKLWPAPVARGARRWVQNNVAGGQIRDLVFDIAEPLRRRIEGSERRLIGDTAVSMAMEGVRFDVAGEIPPVRNAMAQLDVRDGTTVFTLESGRIFMENDLTADASNGVLTILPQTEDWLIPAQLAVDMDGTAEAIGHLIQYRPVQAQRAYPFDPADLTGDVSARLTMDFVINNIQANGGPDWEVDLTVRNAGSAAPIEGRQLASLDGTINVNRQRAVVDVDGTMDGLPAQLELVVPIGESDVEPERNIELVLDTGDREQLAPGLDAVVSGVTPVTVEALSEGANRIEADLSDARLTVPWLGWTKSPGIAAQARFDLETSDGGGAQLRNLAIEGDGFLARGSMVVSASGLSQMTLPDVQMNSFDDFAVEMRRADGGYSLGVTGQSYDARALIRRLREAMGETGSGNATPMTIEVELARVLGFGEQVMRDVRARVRMDAQGLQSASVTGVSGSGLPFSVALEGVGAQRRIRVEALDAGEILDFTDLYGQIRGGVLDVNLAGAGADTLAGSISIRDFRVFDEPRLQALVATPSSETGSLRDAIDRDIDTSEVPFDLAYADVSFGPGTLDLSRGVVRGPLVGFTVQGRARDQNNQMRMTGTFLPAYGLNTIFADIPILGTILGNGRDRGLIGVTFLLTGDADEPEVTVNPLSVIAPGVFRSIFEFR